MKLELPDDLCELACRLDEEPDELVRAAVDDWLARRQVPEDQLDTVPPWRRLPAGRARSFTTDGGGLYHDFVLVNREQFAYGDYSKFVHSPEAVRLHDDLISYLRDGLNWLPTLNPAGRGGAVPSRGLHEYGPTVIEKEGAEKLSGILAGWARVFQEAPTAFVLTGGWTYREGETEGAYERLVFERDEVLWLLRELRRLADAVDDRHYLLHLGI